MKEGIGFVVRLAMVVFAACASSAVASQTPGPALIPHASWSCYLPDGIPNPDDGEIIIVRNGGEFGALVPTFETRLDGPYAFLNEGRYLSSNPGPGQGGVALTFFESDE